MIPDCAAIVVAAGQSRRMGFDKLAAPLGGMSVLEHSIRRLMQVPELTHLVVVCSESRFAPLATLSFPKPLQRVDGGARRQDSVAAGLHALAASPFIAVHDAARPLVAVADVTRVVTAAVEHGAAALARPAADTVKRADARAQVTASVERDGLWLIETPQVFRRDWLVEAYRHVAHHAQTITDEVSALQALGHPIQLVASQSANWKITLPADLTLAEALLRTRLDDPSDRVD